MTTWLAAWAAGSVLASITLAASGSSSSSQAPIEVVAVTLVIGWSVYLTAMALLSRRAATGSFASDYGFRARLMDAVGLPIGVACQLVLVPLVYLPLRALWPTTFANDRLQDNASSLADRTSHPGLVVLLVVVVALGAPVVEELVYRGLVQRSLAGRLSESAAWIATAALFTLIHFRPVEYPGLAAFALVVGAAPLLTGRLGPAIAIHIGFNATGLLLAYF